VFLLSLVAFGGPQAHIAMFIERLVDRRKYLTENELMELYALCQFLPGPTSTQTITAIGFRLGGARLAYFTLFVWAIPAVIVMAFAAVLVNYLHEFHLDAKNYARFIQPMAVGFVTYSAYMISSKIVNTKTAVTLMVISAVVSYFFNSPWLLPFMILAGGIATTFKFKQMKRERKAPLKIEWANFVLFLAVPVMAAIIGGVTHWLPIRLFENFYRNGSLIFGGGQVLIPLMYGEFVEFKEYLTSNEFLTGIALMQIVPGPLFSISAYVGGLTMRDYGLLGQLTGSLFSSLGIFLPGIFLIFFVIRFWDHFKHYRVVKASLEGVNAVSAGLVVSAAILLFKPIEVNVLNIGIIVGTIIILIYNKIPVPFLILGGILAGVLI
ncbi:MAG: chromate efflux transporter, partial [Cytophagales bacterium]|nr:chromate efflux transporter [Cytophagales bacterium]